MPPKQTASAPTAGCTFLTNHAAVLACVAADPEARQRDIAARVGITERAVQRIVAELADGGYLAAARVGRRRRYEVNAAAQLRGPLVGGLTVGRFVGLLTGNAKRK